VSFTDSSCGRLTSDVGQTTSVTKGEQSRAYSAVPGSRTEPGKRAYEMALELRQGHSFGRRHSPVESGQPATGDG